MSGTTAGVGQGPHASEEPGVGAPGGPGSTTAGVGQGPHASEEPGVGAPGGPGSSVLLLSGPNLDLLGQREPAVYGTATLDDHVKAATEAGRALGLAVDHLQSNDEGRLVEAVHAARGRHQAIVANLGALTHTSWSLHDALAAFDGVVVELHLSNPAAREPFRHTSVVAPVADGLVAGFGGLGYELAMQAVAQLLAAKLPGDRP